MVQNTPPPPPPTENENLADLGIWEKVGPEYTPPPDWKWKLSRFGHLGWSRICPPPPTPTYNENLADLGTLEKIGSDYPPPQKVAELDGDFKTEEF